MLLLSDGISLELAIADCLVNSREGESSIYDA